VNRGLELGRIAAIAVAIVLVGATACVRYEPRPISAEDSVDRFTRRELTEPGLREFIGNAQPPEPARWPLPSWDLRRLTLAALYFHPDLDVARAEWAVARAEVVRAGQRPNPALSVVSQYNTTTPVDLVSPWILGLDFDIPIEVHGKKKHRVSAALSRAEAARLDVATTAWNVRADLRRRFLELYAADRDRDALRAQLKVRQEIVSLLELRYDAGEVGPEEVTRSRVELDAVGFALAAAERERAGARVALARAIGISSAALEGVELDFAEFERLPGEPSPAVAQRQALVGRPDVLAALSRYAASEADLRIEIARQYPDLHLGPGFELDQGDNKWTLGIGLELPLLHHNEGGIAVADARRGRAAAEFEALQARVIGELESAMTAFRKSLSETTAADEWLEHLAEQERWAKQRLDAGDASRFEFDLVRLQSLEAGRRRMETHVRAQRAVGQIEDAMRHPLDLGESLWLEGPRGETVPAVTSAATPDGRNDASD
jgi:outer membrane protein TolC